MISSLLATPFSMSAYESQDLSLSNQSQPIIFSKVKGIEWVKNCIQQYPEILWLADADGSRVSLESRKYNFTICRPIVQI